MDDETRFGKPREELQEKQAARTFQRNRETPHARHDALVARNLEIGLTCAPSIGDRNISTFARGHDPAFAGINTFLKMPYLEDARRVGEYDAAILGVPFDTGTTYRSGARFGPQGVRRISGLYSTFHFELGVDLFEMVTLCDLGDVFVIPGNLEKAFDQISRAVSHVFRSGTFPIMIGGDHSIGYPCVRGIAPHVNGNIGIIHVDRHVDTAERDMDERMHSCPWFHATNIANAPPKNLVQFGIGGWSFPRSGIETCRERGITVMTITDIMELGLDKALDIAIEVANEGTEAVYLSFDVDAVDACFLPGTGYPEPGGFLPREALHIAQRVARETNLCGAEIVEIAPPYDNNDVTSLFGARLALDILGNLADTGKLPRQSPSWLKPEPATEPWAL